MPRPNIICIVTDQHRADHLGCYGNKQVKTPNVDRLAREGVTFTESYVCNPVCSPNRASMFTGTYPQRHGLTENGFTLDPCTKVLPQMLGEAGYHTACVGKLHLAPFGMKSELAKHEWELYESYELWNKNGGHLPSQYYWLDEVCLVDGHGHYAFGDYKRWLEKEHPGAYDKLRKEKALAPPTCPREWWKASIPKELHYNTFIADRTIDFLKRRANEEEPFFLWCSFPDPHHPYSPPQPYCDMYDPSDIEFNPKRRSNELSDLPEYVTQAREGKIKTGGLSGDVRALTDDDYKQIIAHTYGMITMVDDQVGRIMKSLEELSLLDNTIVMFMSDHADLMGDHWLINKGPFLFRSLLRVPTIWRVPGCKIAGTQSAAMVSTVDFCPTVVDLAGASPDPELQGKSYKSILDGSAGRVQDSVLIEFDESYLKDRLRQMRTKDWAITAYLESSRGLLFDLRNDPDELYNLWDKPAHATTKSELLSELHRRWGAPRPWTGTKAVHA